MTERNRTEQPEPPSNAIGKILSFIRERRYQPSERLPSERDFAEKFDTSRGAVREALAALEAMRVIERRPNSGIYLRNSDESSIEALVLHAESGLPFQANEIADVFEVRRMLEVQAARLACARRTPDNIRDLRAILSDTEKRLAKKQTIEREDEAFHLAIFAATKNDILLRVVKSFYELSRQRRRVYFADHSRGRRSYEDHCEILNAIEGRRVGHAEQKMNEHLSQTIETWQTLLGEPKIPARR
ncbi:FadR/GntR family transcriptional regulator [Tardiphaga sp.]|uniref:FadR/GntR family transcriptional regulator n=1 Tax=Tardiphaga sp. TaxID=1926292 RepID=UPI00352B89AF